MIFFFRAAFWTLVVSAFIPAGFYAPQDGAFARQAEDIATSALEDRASVPLQTAAVCEGRETLCETAGEFGRFAGWAASMAADQAESAFESFTQSRAASSPTRPAPSATARSAEEVFAAAAGGQASR